MNPDHLGDHLPPLAGDGVQLRWLTTDDVPDLRAIFSDADVVRFMSIPQLTSEAATLKFQLGEVQDAMLFGLLRRDWDARTAPKASPG